MTAHPLAVRLVEHLRPARRKSASSSLPPAPGRNTEALRAAGLDVVTDRRSDAAASVAPFAGFPAPSRRRSRRMACFTARRRSSPETYRRSPSSSRRTACSSRPLVPSATRDSARASVSMPRLSRRPMATSAACPTPFSTRAQLGALLDPHFAIESLEEHEADKAGRGRIASGRSPAPSTGSWSLRYYETRR